MMLLANGRFKGELSRTPSFPSSNTIQPLAKKAGHALGFGGQRVKVEAHFHKAEGHFSFHKDRKGEGDV